MRKYHPQISGIHGKVSKKSQSKSIYLKADSDREFFLIHGYTSGPSDFKGLSQQLHQALNANVKAIQLAGHGTRVQDLDHLEYRDFWEQVDSKLRKDLQKGRRIVVGGVSLGALLALNLAASHPLEGVISVSPPYTLRFPFSLKGIESLGRCKKYWKKEAYDRAFGKKEDVLRYDCMHVNGLKIVKQAAFQLKSQLPKITCPLLSIHSYADPIGHCLSVDEINKGVRSWIREDKLLDTSAHNLLFSPYEHEVCQSILHFSKKHLFKPQSEKESEKIAAIVPSFNEAARIGSVLRQLAQSDLLDEIIVVDDGSEDHTEQVVRAFSHIKYIKNPKNQGKASAMEKGVRATDASILFFCDADLIGLKKEIIQEIIEPVKQGEFNMFMGLLDNPSQKAVRLIALNSGQRAMRREVWETLPDYFKQKYRIEAGLNHHAKHHFGGFGYKRFEYSNPIKEKKYGFLKGTALRWGMNMDVMAAYLRNFLEGWMKYS